MLARANAHSRASATLHLIGTVHYVVVLYDRDNEDLISRETISFISATVAAFINT